jgi:hypothetical protein
MLKAVLFVVCFEALANNVLQPSEGDFTLRKANALAEIYNWHAAAPYYAEAEKFFTAKHDMRKALLAHIGYIRATFEERSFSETARYFSNICDEPLAANDPEVQFKCLIAKGDTDAEIDSAPAEADWRRVLALARRLHNEKWRIRATGEIGFARYVQGDHTTAKKNTGIALLQCQKTGDWAGEIRFSERVWLWAVSKKWECHTWITRSNSRSSIQSQAIPTWPSPERRWH